VRSGAGAGISCGCARHSRADRKAVVWPLNDRIALCLLAFLASWAPAALAAQCAAGRARWWLITAVCIAIAGRSRWGRAAATLLKLVPLIWPLLICWHGPGSAAAWAWCGCASEWEACCYGADGSFAILAVFALVLVLMALGRRSELPCLRWGAVSTIEFRGAHVNHPAVPRPEHTWVSCCRPGLAPIGSGGRPGCSLLCGLTWLKRSEGGLASYPAGSREASLPGPDSLPQAYRQVCVCPSHGSYRPAATWEQFISLLQDTTCFP